MYKQIATISSPHLFLFSSRKILLVAIQSRQASKAGTGTELKQKKFLNYCLFLSKAWKKIKPFVPLLEQFKGFNL